jgi:integrase
MASIRKKGNKFLAEVRIKTFYAAKTFVSKLDAQQWALDQEKQRGKHSGIQVAKTLSQAFDRYAKEISPTHKGCRWEEIRFEKLKRDPVADIVISDLSTQDLQDWVDRQTISGSSIRREFNLISATLTAARKKWKWITHEPQRDVSLPRANPSRDRLLHGDELERLLQALEYTGEVITIRQKIACAALLALETAMRQGEIWGLEWDRVFLSQQYVALPDTKNGTKRNVPLSKKAVELLKAMPTTEGRVFTVPQASAGVIFKRACDLAKVHNFHFHDLRHEAITRLAKRLTVLELARMVGHKDLRSLSIYYNATATELAAKLD